MGFFTLTILSAVLATEQHASEEANLAANPSFEQGEATPAAWELFSPAGSSLARDATVSHSGQTSARIEITPEGGVEYPSFKCAVTDIAPGETYLATVWARTERMTDLGGYIVLEFMRRNQRLSFAQGDFTGSGDHDWMELTVWGMVPDETDCMKVALVAHGTGKVWFDDVRLTRTGETPAAFEGKEVRLRVRWDRTLCRHFHGFGAHGDFYLTRKANLERGVDDGDRELVLQRVKAMRPHLIRTFFAYQWWEPEEGRQTPDSEEMRDYVFWVRFLKSIGTSVLLTPWGDHFAYSEWMGDGDSKLPRPTKREEMIRSLVDLVEFLKRRQGLTNIKYLCLMNEPDNDATRPVAVEEYARLNRLLDRKLRDRGLRKGLFLLTSDDCFGNPIGASNWFRQVTAQGLDYCDGVSSHAYKEYVPELAFWVRDRLNLLHQMKRPKPLFITEFGYGGETYKNRENAKYEYGLYLADFAVTALRERASAALMWCLMDTHYAPELRQEWGLWRYKDANWEPRPGFHAWSLITRYTRPDSAVLQVEVHPSAFAVRTVALRSSERKLTVLIVNKYKRPLRALVETGLSPWATLRLCRYARRDLPVVGETIVASEGMPVGRGSSLSLKLPGESFALLTQLRD